MLIGAQNWAEGVTQQQVVALDNDDAMVLLHMDVILHWISRTVAKGGRGDFPVCHNRIQAGNKCLHVAKIYTILRDWKGGYPLQSIQRHSRTLARGGRGGHLVILPQRQMSSARHGESAQLQGPPLRLAACGSSESLQRAGAWSPSATAAPLLISALHFPFPALPSRA